MVEQIRDSDLIKIENRTNFIYINVMKTIVFFRLYVKYSG